VPHLRDSLIVAKVGIRPQHEPLPEPHELVILRRAGSDFCRIIEIVSTTGTVPSIALSQAPAEHPYFADLYTFDWKSVTWKVPAVGGIAIALCLIIGVIVGHPSAGLIAGGGAFTIGFGVNQRIADSRLTPMLAATLAMAISTVVGMTVGHHGYEILLAAGVWSFVYGLLTARAAGVAWVGQQAAVTLFVTSAFPAGLHAACLRALLILAGGALQIVITSALLRLIPELKADLLEFHHLTVHHTVDLIFHSHSDSRRNALNQLRQIPLSLPRLSHTAGFAYAVRLTLTVVLSAEIYRRLGIQSGYWIPMTAMLVQKPAFFETFNRALLRIAGTVAGAGLSTYALAHLHPEPITLAILATLAAFLSYVTISVNYGVFSVFLTSYIVFLLSLNSLPGPVIAHRRALCTIAGGLIALAIHLDALRRHKSVPSET
jgi:hypothetical protein